MQPLLAEGDGPLTVSWGNTASEVRLVNGLREREVTLEVPDLVAMRRAAISIGGNFCFTRMLQVNTFQTLSTTEERNPEWPDYAKSTGFDVTEALLIAVTAGGIRDGRPVPDLRSVADACMFEDISVQDAKIVLFLGSVIGEENA
jgi:hypothetical protein